MAQGGGRSFQEYKTHRRGTLIHGEWIVERDVTTEDVSPSPHCVAVRWPCRHLVFGTPGGWPAVFFCFFLRLLMFVPIFILTLMDSYGIVLLVSNNSQIHHINSSSIFSLYRADKKKKKKTTTTTQLFLTAPNLSFPSQGGSLKLLPMKEGDEEIDPCPGCGRLYLADLLVFNWYVVMDSLFIFHRHG